MSHQNFDFRQTTKRSSGLFDTRGVPLWNLTALCRLLDDVNPPATVKALANKAIGHGVFPYTHIKEGQRLPTRLNHHVIALRALGLVTIISDDSHGRYNLSLQGVELAQAVRNLLPEYLSTPIENPTPKVLSDEGFFNWDELPQSEFVQETVLPAFREMWRPILVQNSYVRDHWLKFFMPRASFSLEEFILEAENIRLVRLPASDRKKTLSQEADSGYKLLSPFWPEFNWTEEHRREVHQGLRRWTHEAYLTEDAVLEEFASPFRHLNATKQVNRNAEQTFEIACRPIKKWLHSLQDIEQFDDLVRQTLKRAPDGRRATLPDLIFVLSEEHNLCKDNVKEMLVQLYKHKGSNYFFERGSRFLIENAFDLNTPNKPAVYYLKLGGVWRTGIVLQT